MLLFYLLIVFHLVSLVFVSDENKNSGTLYLEVCSFVVVHVLLIARKYSQKKPAAENTVQLDKCWDNLCDMNTAQRKCGSLSSIQLFFLKTTPKIAPFDERSINIGVSGSKLPVLTSDINLESLSSNKIAFYYFEVTAFSKYVFDKLENLWLEKKQLKVSEYP